MASTLDISIPTSAVAPTPKPHTVYNVNLRQPLRSYTVQRRYSEFEALHAAITAQAAGYEPPAPLPGKSWFTRTVSSPQLTERRRAGLEAYLRAIAASDEARWRRTEAWRQFLNLPPGGGGGSGAASGGAARGAGAGQSPIVDPTIWLDVHRELKTQLGEVRQAMRRRADAGTAKGQHEASAEAKRYLVRSGTSIAALESGLARLAEQAKAAAGGGTAGRGSGGSERDAWAPPAIGEGELRRRRDLLSGARKERDALEMQLSSFPITAAAAAGPLDSSAGAMASPAQKEALFNGGGGSSPGRTSSHRGPGGGGRRVLGGPLKETERTRELDNEGVLQLQKQIMQEQDQDVGELTHTVRRMKEMGMQINQELVYQNEMLGMLDQDAERVADKIKIAKKRVGELK